LTAQCVLGVLILLLFSLWQETGPLKFQELQLLRASLTASQQQ